MDESRRKFDYYEYSLQKLKRHLAELDSIVEDAIKYLQEGQANTTTDHDVKPMAFSHVDSLLIASKVRYKI